MFATPTQADSGSSHSKQAFTYDTLKLTTRSHFKLASANSNEATQTLKLLLLESSMKRQIERRLEMIGVAAKVSSSNLGCSQEESEVSEVI